MQIFDGEGRYQGQWNNLHRPCGLFADRRNGDHVYVGELGPDLPVNIATPNLGPRVTVFDKKGARVGRFGPTFGEKPGEFTAPHTVVTDSRGDVYVGEVPTRRAASTRIRRARSARSRNSSASTRRSEGARRRESGRSGPRSRDDLARLEVLDRGFHVDVPRRGPGRAAPPEERALDRRRLHVAHRQITGDVEDGRVVHGRAREDLVEVRRDDAAVDRARRALVAPERRSTTAPPAARKQRTRNPISWVVRSRSTELRQSNEDFRKTAEIGGVRVMARL